MSHPYNIVSDEDGSRVLTVLAGSKVIVANGDHPNFDSILAAAQDESDVNVIEGLADISIAVGSRFSSLSERVKVAAGRLFFDGEEVQNSLAKHIVRCLDDPTVGSWKPLVRFMERLATNPNPHSRNQLFDWLDAHDFTVAEDGRFVAYKGCRVADGVPVSINRGPAIVDGQSVNGAVPNKVGSIVEFGRSRIDHDPAVGCSVGLHAGTYGYASSFSQGVLLKVLIDPRDVASVPTDCGAQKLRVSRYEVVESEVVARDERPIAYSEYDEEGAYCDYCGDGADIVDGFCEFCDTADGVVNG